MGHCAKRKLYARQCSGGQQLLRALDTCGEMWLYAQVAGSRTDCPYCTTRRTCQCESLLVKFPSIAKEWDHVANAHLKTSEGIPLHPENCASNSNLRVGWTHVVDGEQHHWEQVVSVRTRLGWGCQHPACKPPRKKRSEVEKASILIKLKPLWHPTKNGDLKLEDVFGSIGREKYWWFCPEINCHNSHAHEWEARLVDMVTAAALGKGNGCAVCAGRKVCLCNSLQGKRPDLAAEFHTTKNKRWGKVIGPDQVSLGSNYIAVWICSACKHEWEAVVKWRTQQKCPTGCPCCNKPGRKPKKAK